MFLTTNLEPLFCLPKFKMSFIVWLVKSIFCVTGFQKLVRMCLVVFPFVFLSYFGFIDLVGSMFMYLSHLKTFLPLFLSLFLHPSVLFCGVRFIYAGPVAIVLEVTEAVCVLFWICCVTMSHIHCFFYLWGLICY